MGMATKTKQLAKVLRVQKKTLKHLFSHFLLTGAEEERQEMMQSSLKLMPSALQ